MHLSPLMLYYQLLRNCYFLCHTLLAFIVSVGIGFVLICRWYASGQMGGVGYADWSFFPPL